MKVRGNSRSWHFSRKEIASTWDQDIDIFKDMELETLLRNSVSAKKCTYMLLSSDLTLQHHHNDSKSMIYVSSENKDKIRNKSTYLSH